MEAVTGTIKSYNTRTGEGLIALDGEGEPVRVDLSGSAGVRLRKGQRVRFSRVHRPRGVFAFCVRVI